MNGLVQRAALLWSLREFFARRQVIEVQTPVLAPNTVTDPDVESVAVPGYGFLQTSPEYQMKRLLAAGAPSIYQLGPVFRHEEIGRLHNIEFTMLEWYRLDFDHDQLMDEVAKLVDGVLGPASYTTVTYAELVGDLDRPRDELDLAFAEASQALNPGRFFVIDYPAEQGALARLQPDNSAVAARFELVIDGVELANGYWELLDPEEHLQRFAQDQKSRNSRGLGSVEIDSAFMAALEAGLPTCAGVALGVDRLLMLAMGQRSLDKALTFRNF
ncbi:MAG: EF-P lysine aminoacylase GenX [Pseudomonadales bacterium]|jgi:lysyl-tRNA synthetase class 2